MATKTDVRYRLSFGTKLRLLLRMLAITGVVCAAFGALLVAPIWNTLSLDLAMNSIEGGQGQTAQVATYLIAGGLGAIALSLLFEFLAAFSSSSKSLLGLNSTFQTLLAVAIVVAVNVYSFQHYQRWDLTRDKLFTLPANLVEELKKLRGETQIVVLQQHKTFGQLSSKPDGFDYAAERKVVEKVRDLVDLFREIGPQFRVTVLDVEEETYDKRLQEVTENKPLLAEAIKAAPENSIFFYADDKVQRLSFNEFYQLNKTASKEKSNLVLQPQGVETFTRRVLAIEEKKPKVALCVIHPVFTTKSDFQDTYSHAGLRKSLEANGFEVVDVILKRWGRPVQPAVYSPDEFQVDKTRSDLARIRRGLSRAPETIAELKTLLDQLRDPQKWAKYREEIKLQIRRDPTEEERRENIELIQDRLKQIDEQVTKLTEEEKTLSETSQKLEADDRLAEARRSTEVGPKLEKILNECDLLIVPRHTWINIPDGNYIFPRAYALTDANDFEGPFLKSKQAEVMKAFMKRGKPVLACLGPNFENPYDRGPRSQLPAGFSEKSGVLESPLDEFESLLEDCGVELGKQIILFDDEEASFESTKLSEELLGTSLVKLPPVQFESATEIRGGQRNPIRDALRSIRESVGQPLDISLRHPRPVYLKPGLESRLTYGSPFLFTAPQSWNESFPFGTGRDEIPRYEPAGEKDPKKNTREEERRGPFPIGVALETKVPIDWYEDKYKADFGQLRGVTTLPGLFGQADLTSVAITALADEEKQKLRLAVIGQGGVFSGKELTPPTEKLLLYSCNWLLGRDEKLPRTDLPTWSYPRVELSKSEKFYWHWGAFLGLPLFFVYIGLMVLLIRRVR